jgi:hypothetical protein
MGSLDSCVGTARSGDNFYLFHATFPEHGPIAILTKEEYQERYTRARAVGSAALMFDEPADLERIFTPQEGGTYANQLLGEPEVLGGDMPDGHYVISYENPALHMDAPAPINQSALEPVRV